MTQHGQLIRMANQIALNLGAIAGPDAAVATADHIAAFWDPRMKAMLLTDGEGLSPVAIAAVELLRDRSHPPDRI